MNKIKTMKLNGKTAKKLIDDLDSVIKKLRNALASWKTPLATPLLDNSHVPLIDLLKALLVVRS